MTDWVAELCSHLGVQSQYRGYEGQTVRVARDTRIAVLRALELNISSNEDAREMLQEMQSKDAGRPAPHEVIVQAGQASEISLTQAVEWRLEAEGTGEVLATGSTVDHISLPSLPIGIHSLHLSAKSGDTTTWILARPDHAVRLEDRIAEPHIWGVLAALYGLTDGPSAPIGTYALLGHYAETIAGHGADFLGINPIHAMGQSLPDDVISPYSPSHRAFLNTWHCAGAGQTKHFGSDLIDYPSALHHTEQALASQFVEFSQLPADAPDRQAYEAYVASARATLHEFAVFEALSARFGPDWRAWPALYRDHDAEALSKFEHYNARVITQRKWAQWEADRQLSRAQSRATDAGMRIGIYLDLAVGPRLGGAETWVKGTSLITGATLGAPPDPLGPSGQSWGLAPQSPLKCRTQGYAGFARLLRAVMRHAGMIRIDHVLGLMRSFWIPEGSDEGTYVSYPFDALLAVVAIESARNGTIVVGEDLGLVPEGLRDQLALSGIYGLDVLQYMRTPAGGFVDTADTRELAVCGFATHDTPTVAGFFAAEDAEVRHRLGSINEQTLDQTRADRALAQRSLGTSKPVLEIHRQLARARSSMVAIQLDDIAERTSQQNLPGTIDEYPNWRLKAPLSLSEISTSKAFARLGADMLAENRSNPKKREMEHELQDCSNQTH
ncbi:4-alpha-glucanotransferase [Litoreibacter roseus]|uniref:4-alpha-glucanotransferase n=1 Tax=Litoreibacter roseus TaxID=2601869 RepID=A0A6N6JJ07_9RHOB|nr:4-alpha-glucanotransferase [Litoreibacter roseus]GFE66055.1 4-alpha-glucanotransferase [Litoreibacter roseus]